MTRKGSLIVPPIGIAGIQDWRFISARQRDRNKFSIGDVKPGERRIVGEFLEASLGVLRDHDL